MVDSIDKTPLEIIVDTLIAHGVEFMVVGGQAETLYGSARVTFDVDLCYRRTDGNFVRLAKAIAILHPRLRDVPPDVPFLLDAKSIASGCNFTLTTDAGPLDILGYLEPLGTYDDVVARSNEIDLGGVTVRVISLDDLIAIKQHIQRPKDRDSLINLLAIKRLRDDANSSNQ